MTERTVLLDLDGTLYERGAAVPRAAEAVRELRELGYVLRFCTNTDSQSDDMLLARLHALGIPAAAGEIFTPVSAAQRVLAARSGSQALILSNAAVRDELAGACRVLDLDAAAQATHVVIGDCQDELTYRHLDAAFRAVRAGAELLALQRGRYYRAADGDHLDTGAIVAAVEFASEVPARVLGKPSLDFLSLAVEAGDPGWIWVVGDDRNTDIRMANKAGAHSVQVRTGKFTDQSNRNDLPEAAHVIDSIADLPTLLARP